MLRYKKNKTACSGKDEVLIEYAESGIAERCKKSFGKAHSALLYIYMYMQIELPLPSPKWRKKNRRWYNPPLLHRPLFIIASAILNNEWRQQCVSYEFRPWAMISLWRHEQHIESEYFLFGWKRLRNNMAAGLAQSSPIVFFWTMRRCPWPSVGISDTLQNQTKAKGRRPRKLVFLAKLQWVIILFWALSVGLDLVAYTEKNSCLWFCGSEASVHSDSAQ